MNEIQEMKNRRDQLTSEMENLRAALVPYETALDNPETIEQGRENETREQYNERKRKIDSLDMELYRLNPKIQRYENIANHVALMTEYTEKMANWAADEIELTAKRQSLSTRLKEVRHQALEEMTSARQAETLAATAYAQAVAWGDLEGEKAASNEAQKAAKNLAAATEQNRRQHLIITALEQELVTIDQHITEAQEEHHRIEKKALSLAHEVLEEQWNEAANSLLELGGKLYATSRMINRDPISLLKLTIPQLGENSGNWTWSELADRSSKHHLQDILAM